MNGDVVCFAALAAFAVLTASGAIAAQRSPAAAATTALKQQLAGRANLDGRRIETLARMDRCRTRIVVAGGPAVVLDWREVGTISQSGLRARHGVGLSDRRGRQLHVFDLHAAREADLAEASMSVIASPCEG